MELDRELLDRYIDGELPPSEAARVVQLMARHPGWDAYVRKQERLKQMLRAPLLELGDEMPERLLKTVGEAPVSWRWRLRRALAKGLTPARLAPIGAALAAGLVIGIALRPAGEFTIDKSGRVLARGDVGKALDAQLASAQSADAVTQIGISFRDKGGRDCRTFSSGAHAGLACHETGGWVIQILTGHDAEDAGAVYRMASSGMPQAVRQAVNVSIQGAPFDAGREALAKAQGWRGE
jgi:hypothetical protein